MTSTPALKSGDRVLVGSTLVTVDQDFADSLNPGDVVLGIASSGQLRRIPQSVQLLVRRRVEDALAAFRSLQGASTAQVSQFFALSAEKMSDDSTFESVAQANQADVEAALAKGRSTTRLVLSDKMRAEMVTAFKMWESIDMSFNSLQDTISHSGWEVQQWKAPLGVIGFVFEGRPNVFADATGVLKGGNTVVFRIGSDALRTAKAIMDAVIHPALAESGLPSDCVVLLESAEHAAGWALFSENRLSLAVARGSGQAVSELGSIAQQSGVPASLHGTGGAWMIVGQKADADRLSSVVQHSLDRKVCNTLNVVCIPRHRAAELVPVVYHAAERAASVRGLRCRVHAVNGSEEFLPESETIEVKRADGAHYEQQITISQQVDLSHEFEWEENPEFFIALVQDVAESVLLFNEFSPQFVVSVISDDAVERDVVWNGANAPFVGDGFTRWVDGQFALLRPELGLSNWQSGRLFARGGVLSGDSAFTVRLQVKQNDVDLHR
jgi:glutamate-5-semialdehyde dehydrogenase